MSKQAELFKFTQLRPVNGIYYNVLLYSEVIKNNVKESKYEKAMQKRK